MNQEKDLYLIRRFRFDHDFFSRDELVRKYLPMIRRIIKNHHIPLIDVEDYFQEGSIGLLKAIEKYDPENYSIKFSTFAYICILRRIFNILKSSFGKYSGATTRTLSLNSFIDKDESCTLLDSIPDFSSEPFTHIENGWIEQKLEAVLKAHLSPVEFQVLLMILNGYQTDEIQQAFSLSFKVVDNARTRARLKLKKILFRYGSLLSPQIPLKARKRKDLTIRLATHPA
jgi:RNA polymerase sporulation-specific sigma factor